jgi:hypothetical protein
VATKVAIRSRGYVVASQKINLQKQLIFSDKEPNHAKVIIKDLKTLNGVIM